MNCTYHTRVLLSTHTLASSLEQIELLTVRCALFRIVQRPHADFYLPYQHANMRLTMYEYGMFSVYCNTGTACDCHVTSAGNSVV